jgi:hypothetical protein
MSDANETPKDRVYALCDELGYDAIKEKIETKNMSNFASFEKRYAHSWLKKETDKISNDKRITKATDRAFWSMVAALVSAFAAIVTIFLK